MSPMPLNPPAGVDAPPETFNFAQHLLAANEGRAAKAAFVDDLGTLTYGALAERVRRTAAGLRSLGIKREERVLLLMQDVTDWPVAFLGAMYAGIVPVAVNTLLTPDDYAYMLEHSRAQAVLVSGALLPALKGALVKADHEVHKVVVSRPIAPLDFGEIAFDAFVEAHSPLARPAATGADDPGFWLYSSGSTGRPKGTVHSHGNPYWTCELYAKRVLELRESDICFSAAKLFFAYGLGNALTFPMSVGATTILMAERPTPDATFRRWLGVDAGPHGAAPLPPGAAPAAPGDPAPLNAGPHGAAPLPPGAAPAAPGDPAPLNAGPHGAAPLPPGGAPAAPGDPAPLSRLKPTVFYGAPTGFAGMLAHPQLPAREQVALRLVSSAGEALPADLGERFQKHFGIDIVDGIGSTEMLHIFISNTPARVRYGTTGWPVPGYQIELRSEDGGPVPDGEPGDLYIHGPSAAMMYWGNRQKTRDTFQGGWTKSGDKYVHNADGTYTYAGRSDDMLKVSGIYVSPFEVEATLVQHPAVLEAAVIGVPDAEGLTKTKAFVVLKPGSEASDAELKAFVKDKLAPYKYPRQIEFVAELPKTATGKIQRFKLRDQEKSRA